MMPTYSLKRPVKALINLSEEQKKIYHTRYIYDNKVYPNIMSLTPEEKSQWFKIHKENEDLIHKIYGDKMLDYLGVTALLAKSARDGIDEPLVNEYKEWLKNE